MTAFPVHPGVGSQATGCQPDGVTPAITGDGPTASAGSCVDEFAVVEQGDDRHSGADARAAPGRRNRRRGRAACRARRRRAPARARRRHARSASTPSGSPSGQAPSPGRGRRATSGTSTRAPRRCKRVEQLDRAGLGPQRPVGRNAARTPRIVDSTCAANASPRVLDLGWRVRAARAARNSGRSVCFTARRSSVRQSPR